MKKRLLKSILIILMIVLIMSIGSSVFANEKIMKINELTEEEVNSLLKGIDLVDSKIDLEKILESDEVKKLISNTFEEEKLEYEEFSKESQKTLKKLGVNMAFGEKGEVFISPEFETKLVEISENFTKIITSPVFSTLIFGFMTFFFGILIVKLIITIIIIIAKWRIFTKAGKHGWAVLLPVYRDVVLFEVAGVSPAYLLIYIAMFIPVVGPFIYAISMLILKIIVSINLSKNFKKTGAFAIGLILLPTIFYAILGFSKSEYEQTIEIKTKKNKSKKENKNKKDDKIIEKLPVDSDETKVITADIETVVEDKEEEKNKKDKEDKKNKEE